MLFKTSRDVFYTASLIVLWVYFYLILTLDHSMKFSLPVWSLYFNWAPFHFTLGMLSSVLSYPVQFSESNKQASVCKACFAIYWISQLHIMRRQIEKMHYLFRMVGYIGFKHGEFIPDIVPVLISALKDDTPAVARQAITCGIDIFRCTLVKVAIQVVDCFGSEFWTSNMPHLLLTRFKIFRDQLSASF